MFGNDGHNGNQVRETRFISVCLPGSNAETIKIQLKRRCSGDARFGGSQLCDWFISQSMNAA